MYTNEESLKRKAEIGKIESFTVANLFFIYKIILICTAHAGPAGWQADCSLPGLPVRRQGLRLLGRSGQPHPAVRFSVPLPVSRRQRIYGSIWLIPGIIWDQFYLGNFYYRALLVGWKCKICCTFWNIWIWIKISDPTEQSLAGYQTPQNNGRVVYILEHTLVLRGLIPRRTMSCGVWYPA